MRYLHPVAVSEKFIAKGIYRSYQDDMLLSKIEAWTRHRVAGGGILTRIDLEGESIGVTTLAEVLTDETGQIERLTVREWNTHPKATYRTLRANYFVFPNEIQATRTYDDQPTDESVVPLLPQGYLHPPFFIFMSLAMVKSVVPAFRPVWNWGGGRLGFSLSEPLSEPLKIDGVSQAPGFIYHFPEGSYTFDQHMILQECKIKSRLVQLTEYAHI